MATLTDPARELSEIADRLNQSSTVVGDKYLADRFGVERWSTDFFKVLTCILDRADKVAAIIARSEMDKDHKDSARQDLENFKAGFTGASLNQRWEQGGLIHMRDHGRPLKYLSNVVRQEVSYPSLTDVEIAEFLKLIDAYLGKLKKSDEGPDFVRQAIVDGLTIFRFQLEHIGWMGAGYALSAFREVMIAYDMAHGFYGGEANPDANAVLKGLLHIITGFKKKVDEAKNWTDATKFAIKVYQVGSAVATPLLLTGTVSPPTI